MENILIIEDNQDVNLMLAQAIKSAGYGVKSSFTGIDGLNEIKTNSYSLVLLDIMLPYKSGDEILKEVRQFSQIPIIIISAKDMISTKIDLLKLGADDYITKPFGTDELLARIRTAIRHSNKIVDDKVNSTRPYSARGLVVDFGKRLVTVERKEIHLTRVEYKIVSMLAQNSGKVITYSSLIEQVWGPYADDNNRILRVNMANIRRKIEKNPGEPEYIFTELGIGYRMIEDENLE